jgi:hypothetical protein
MTRARTFIVLLLLAFALGAMPISLAQEDPAPANEPAVVVGEEPAPPPEDAWTFRFLVPTLLVLTGIALVGVILGYGVRVKGRYRVSQEP